MPLDKALKRLYKLMCRYNWLIHPGVKIDLERLHPGANQEELHQNYYVGKLKKSLVIFLGGSLLAGMLALKAAGESRLEQGYLLHRGTVLEETEEIVVEAALGDEREQFRIQMEPLRLDSQEAERYYQDFCSCLPGLIMGENTSLQEVRKDLELSENYEGYPFTVDWKSDFAEAVSSAGAVKRSEQEAEVLLTANISYGEMEWEHKMIVKVLPEELSETERRHRDLERLLIDAEESSREEQVWALPESLEGEPVQWSRVVEDNSLVLWAGAFVVSIVVYVLGDKDLHGELEKQREYMKREYPDIVHKMALYIGAGMTLQGAFQKVAAEYEQQKTVGKIRSPAYEEMLYTCRELRAGVSENDAYIRFGKRTGLQEYIRFSTLLTQNLKKGSNSLLSRLQEEADRALAERIQMGRKLGEEASTKLLLPMVLMLLVVMVMVMLPAFGSMGL
ncbi:MAG: type II secretion system F family protein [Acetatifactor sp.]|nr:type II secretion system F family protein [Acetatifactor sp.]